MSNDNLNFPTELKYSKNHVWLKEDGNEFLIGIDDYAQDQLGEVLYIELPEVGSSYTKGQEFGSVESVKSVSPLIMPVSGEIIATNNRVEDNPQMINSDCYGQAWIIRIKTDAQGDMNNLLNADEYMRTIQS